MANVKGSKIDTTHLSIEHCMERGFLHRDYIAHCFRWSHVIKHLLKNKKFDSAKILDVGCGVDVALARAMFSGKMTNRNGLYIGVDVNKLEVPKMLQGKSFNIEVKGQTDIVKWSTEHKFDLITSFEVLEHVEPEHMIAMLLKIKSLLTSGGVFIMSTPCYDEFTGAADNHVNEIKYETLGSILEYLGFDTSIKYGTFASQKDYKHQLTKDGYARLFDKLSDYYDSNVLATIFAPLYPHMSRNCLWDLTIGKSTNFQPLEDHVNTHKVLDSSHRFEWDKALKSIGIVRNETI